MQPLLKTIHALGLEKEANADLVLGAYDTIHMEVLDEILHIIPPNRQAEFLEHIKWELDPVTLLKQYDIDHEKVKHAIVRRGDTAIETMQLALQNKHND
ncbi:hypothetical protein KC573_04550 [candidate division WWE3 bacterium]|uniref:Uncharacterized protein n=1 Tax=candidate division WWE3 bacterium TaxID=2053526 RepID=A0A955LWZ0_UNCKA|nr:hypothetical protein [candidate division WWE3 bacterium]